jgi:hypothetical protein
MMFLVTQWSELLTHFILLGTKYSTESLFTNTCNLYTNIIQSKRNIYSKIFCISWSSVSWEADWMWAVSELKGHSSPNLIVNLISICCKLFHILWHTLVILWLCCWYCFRVIYLYKQCWLIGHHFVLTHAPCVHTHTMNPYTINYLVSLLTFLWRHHYVHYIIS